MFLCKFYHVYQILAKSETKVREISCGDFDMIAWNYRSISIVLGKYLRGQWLDHTVVVCLTVKGIVNTQYGQSLQF